MRIFRRRNAVASGGTERGSALLVTLGILALLALMGTTFVTLMRTDDKLNVNYVDDLSCELLARGLLEYCRGILTDDLDRTQKIIDDSPTNPQVASRYEIEPLLFYHRPLLYIGHDFPKIINSTGHCPSKRWTNNIISCSSEFSPYWTRLEPLIGI